MAPTRAVTVDERSAGMRADVYLSLRFDWSRTRAAQAIKAGDVVSSTRTLKPSSLLAAGEVLTMELPDFQADAPRPPCPPVLHEDPRCLAFDKPAGLLMHPVGRQFTWGLINLAREAYPDEELHLAHRLDRETSGVCVVARDAEANRHFKAAFKARETEKTYLAIVRGVPQLDGEVLIDAPIGDDEASPIRLKRAVRPDGQSARTRVRLLSAHGELALVACVPETGRTHQIRVHLDHLGHPILGDKIYGQPPEIFLRLYAGQPLGELEEALAHPRHCLHAARLRIPHPKGGMLEIESPLPPDFDEVLS